MPADDLHLSVNVIYTYVLNSRLGEKGRVFMDDFLKVTSTRARDLTPEPFPSQLVDPFGRAVDYIRISVTDRCDFRCVYCMAEEMTFLPKKDLLTLEELEQVCRTFMSMGTRRIRLTGGEPLVRRNIIQLIRNLGAVGGNG